MLNGEQHRVFRTWLIALLNADRSDGGIDGTDPDVFTPIEPERVAWEQQDHPRRGGLWCTIVELASVPMGAAPERSLVPVPGAPPQQVIERSRRRYETTLRVTLRQQRSDADPRWTDSATLRLSRALLGIGDDELDALLGQQLSIAATGPVVDLGALLSGQQWETGATVEIVVRGWLQRERPIESAVTLRGEVRATPDGGATTVVLPFGED